MNPNYYSITLQNFANLQLKSDTYTVTVTTAGGTTTEYATFIAYGQGPTLVVPSQESSTFTLLYNSTTSVAETSVVYKECLTSSGVNIYTTGNFDSTTSIGQKYSLPLSKF
jgi:hypothetical protein